MANQVEWTEYIVDTFLMELKKIVLKEKQFERYDFIMRTRAKGYPRSYQCYKLNLSVSAIDKAISDLKVYYDRIQREHPEHKLPIRKTSSDELYMDTH